MNQTAPTETSDESRPPATGVEYRIAARIAAVAGVFSLVVCALLLYDYSRRQAEDPAESMQFKTWKSLLTQQPDNEEIRQTLRAVERELRQEYFRRRAFAATGAGLLLGGLVVFLIAARVAATLRRRLPAPGPTTAPVDVEAQWTQVARWSVAALAVLLICGSVGLWFGLGSELRQDHRELVALLEGGSANPGPGPSPGGRPRPNETPSKALTEPYPPPSEEEIRKNWPRFRGPGGSGTSAYTSVPESWDGTSDKGILWKNAVPLPGHNSPVVWENRVFLSGADETSRRVFCFDAKDGALLWQKDAPGTPQSTQKPPNVSGDTGYAAPTTTTDGRRVFAIFANGDLAAFDFEGNLAWNRSLGIPENSYGHASSLCMYRNLLLVQVDQGSSAKSQKSRLYGLSTADGKTVWEVPRQVPNSWSSPIVITHEGRQQVIACGDPWVIAYDPKDGSEIWRAKVLSGDHGPTPVFAGGLVHVGNEYCEWSAIRPDGKGDVTETHVEWSGEEGLPDMCSPLATDEYLFLMPSSSYFTCYDAKTGEFLWDKDFEDDYFTSSPSLVGDRVYLFSNEGKTYILEPGREACKEVGRAELGEECVTSPAFQDGRIYIRGKRHLFCIGKP